VTTGAALAGLFPWLAVVASEALPPLLLRIGVALWALLMVALVAAIYRELRRAAALRRATG
jgi:hypothetical protein